MGFGSAGIEREWYSVDVLLPDYGEVVLVLLHGGIICRAKFDGIRFLLGSSELLTGRSPVVLKWTRRLVL